MMKVESYKPDYITYYKVEFTVSYGEESYDETVFHLTDKEEFKTISKTLREAMENKRTLTEDDVLVLMLGEDTNVVQLKRIVGVTCSELRHYVEGGRQ